MERLYRNTTFFRVLYEHLFSSSMGFKADSLRDFTDNFKTLEKRCKETISIFFTGTFHYKLNLETNPDSFTTINCDCTNCPNSDSCPTIINKKTSFSIPQISFSSGLLSSYSNTSEPIKLIPHPQFLNNRGFGFLENFLLDMVKGDEKREELMTIRNPIITLGPEIAIFNKHLPSGEKMFGYLYDENI